MEAANKQVIIVAGGSGTRMQSKLPKQFLTINDVPIIIYTIQQFLNFNDKIKICVVINPNFYDYCQSLLAEHQLNNKNILLIKGGETRFHSVQNGINALDNNNGITAVHDAVRPCLSLQLITKGFELAQKQQALIPVIPLKDSIRQIKDNNTVALNRNHYCLVQTPQFYNTSLLNKAYQQNFNSTFTDSASVVEALNHPITTMEGETSNLKITTKIDLLIAAHYLKAQ